MLKIFSAFWLIFLISHQVDSVDLPVVSDVQDIISLAHDMGDILSGNIPFKSFFVPTPNPLNIALEKLDGLSKQLTQLAESVDRRMDEVIDAVIHRLPLQSRHDRSMEELHRYIQQIDEWYLDFTFYAANYTNFNEYTVNEFISVVTTLSTGGLGSMLASMLRLFVPERSAIIREGIFTLLTQMRNISKITELCDLSLSHQQRLFEMHQLVVTTELRSFLMAVFAYRLLVEYKNVSVMAEMAKTRAKLVMRSEEYILELSQSMSKATQELYRCDIKDYTPGENYVELIGVFSGYVAGENQLFNAANCPYTCNDAWATELTRACFYDPLPKYRNRHCPKPCLGTISNCGWLGGSVGLCENHHDNIKRYQYVSSENGYYGRWTDCTNGVYKSFKSYLMGWGFSCDACMCTCYEDQAASASTKTFSLQIQYSQFWVNKVVSNVRFVLQDRMIHVQIEESPLLNNGFLNTNESDWVPLLRYTYHSDKSYYGDFSDDEYGHMLVRDIDYAFVTTSMRQFNIDEIRVPRGYVVTGVRLHHKEKMAEGETNNSPIQLEIFAMPYDYLEGRILLRRNKPGIWISGETQRNPPKEYLKPRTHVPQGFNIYRDEYVEHTPIHTPNRYVTITHSSHKSDVAQSMVPYFDSRPAARVSKMALGGLGLIYRHADGYAGFLSFKLLHTDLTYHLNPIMTRDQVKHYKGLYRKPLTHEPVIKK